MIRVVILAVAFICAVSLQAKGDLHLFSIDNKAGKVTPLMIEEAFTKGGFSVDLNSEMNKPFKKQFQKTTFKIFTLMTIHHPKLNIDLVKKYPQAGVFTPMGVGIYQAKNETTLHLSILTSDAQAKILGSDTKILKQIESEVLKVLQGTFPDAKHTLSKDSIKESRKLVTVYEYDLDGEDWEEMQEEVEMNLEEGFKPYGFVVPSSLDFNKEMTQEGKVNSTYNFYKTYSICKLKVIYTVAQSRPEASAFAPCTTIVYNKKGEDKIVIAFPAVYNWLSSADVADKEAKAVLLKAQEDFEAILIETTE